MAVALEQFVKQLADSGVIAPGKLENFVPPKAHPKDAQELARQLVQSKQLTKYQAQEIYQGRAKSLILGNYTIVDKIGAGGMGQVFKAEHRRMHRTVAIKMLPASVTKDAVAVARFQREVEAASKLMHPNIVSAFDADEANGIHFLAMEYVEGSDLSALVKKNGPLSVEKAVNYILQAARGLEFAHGVGVVHRDIKPANLLLDKKGTVKILDMGLARISTGDDAATQAELTGTGAVLGTVDYMAPEQALSTKHADARADIYSLGCSLHYLVTGHAAYDGDTLMAKLLAHRDKPIPSLGADVPEQVQAVFEKMVAKNIEDRYQTMSDVTAALQECVAGTSSTGTPQITSESSPSNGNLSFLAEATAHAPHHGQTKQAKPIKVETKWAKKFSRWNRKKLLRVGGAVGGGLLAAAILAAVVFKLRTKDGMLVVEVNQPDSVVQVLDADGKVEISRPGEKGTLRISVDPGKHRLKVEKNGFQFFSQDFEMESGGTASIKATLLEDKPWFKPAFLEWQRKVAAMPAERQVEAVSKKLQELNPGFDGKVSAPDESQSPTVENGLVTDLRFRTDNVVDISPVRALAGLRTLWCLGWGPGAGKLSDLSPLAGTSLTDLNCGWSRVADLSPLKGMRLSKLNCDGDPVADLSPLDGMSLSSLDFTPKNVTKGIGIIRRMKSLTKIVAGGPEFPPEEFWKKYDAGEFGKPDAVTAAPVHKPITTFNDPAFQQWMKTVAAMPAEQQVEAVVKKLRQLNPGFDGTVTDFAYYDANHRPKIEDGAVTEIGLYVDHVTDLSPVRALAGLKRLACDGRLGNASLSDLSPLKGMPLIEFYCGGTQVSDLSPLRGMPLRRLVCGYSAVTDLSPLKGMPLAFVDCNGTGVSDLSPLKGMPIVELGCERTQVSDLSPLKGAPLACLYCGTTRVFDLSPLKGMPLTKLFCHATLVSDLSPLEGMKLTELDCGRTQVKDLSPVKAAQLTSFKCGNTVVSDLSPLEGMPMRQLWFENTRVASLSPLDGMKLTDLLLTPKNITTGLDVIRRMGSLTEVGVTPEDKWSPDEFWRMYDIGRFGPITTFKRPDFEQWMTEVAALPAELQVEAVVKKLHELNPGFDGQQTHNVEGGTVAELQIGSKHLADISPVRALQKLKVLNCSGEIGRPSWLSDLSPLRGMKLAKLNCDWTSVSDLSPLQGMPLVELDCGGTVVSDLTPLQGMPLTILDCNITHVSDLAPLKRTPLKELACVDARVSDLTPLNGMNLAKIRFGPKDITRGLDAIREIRSLTEIGGSIGQGFPPAEFWKRYDAGEFGK